MRLKKLLEMQWKRRGAVSPLRITGWHDAVGSIQCLDEDGVLTWNVDDAAVLHRSQDELVRYVAKPRVEGEALDRGGLSLGAPGVARPRHRRRAHTSA